MPPPPISTLFPYTTLFRSDGSSKWQWQPLSYPYQAERQDDAAFLRGPNQYNRASRRGSLAADSGRNSKAGSRKVGWETELRAFSPVLLTRSRQFGFLHGGRLRRLGFGLAGTFSRPPYQILSRAGQEAG